MSDLLSALPPKPPPAANRPAPGSNPDETPGLEDDHLDTGQFWSTEDGPTFAEFLDIINPLQHIPIVSTIYRAITGDDIGTGARVAGGMLFGGPIGALVSGITAVFEEASGGDIGEHIAEFINDFGGGTDDSENGNVGSVAAAKADPAAGPQASADIATQTGADIQQAAAQLNRIAVNPSAALGAFQGSPRHKLGVPTANAANVPFPARPMAMPFAAPAAMPSASINPAAVNTHGRDQAVLQPAAFTSNGFAHDARVAGNGPVRADAQQSAQPRTIAAPQLSDAVSRSRRQQADLMLAQWAAQQMALQNGASAAPAKNDEKNASADPRAAAAQAHPMLPPRNASPEWYAQAMDQALNRYRNGANTGAVAAPAVSLRR